MYEIIGKFSDHIIMMRFIIIIVCEITASLSTCKVVVQSMIVVQTGRTSTVLEVQYVL